MVLLRNHVAPEVPKIVKFYKVRTEWWEKGQRIYHAIWELIFFFFYSSLGSCNLYYYTIVLSFYMYLVFTAFVVLVATSFSRRYAISTLKLLSRLIFSSVDVLSLTFLFFCFPIYFPFKTHFVKQFLWSSNILVVICSMIADSTSKSNIHEAGLYRHDNHCKFFLKKI